VVSSAVGSVVRRTVVSGEPLKIDSQSADSESHGSAGSEPQDCVRLDLDTIAHLFEGLSLLDEGPVRAVKVTNGDLASLHAELGVFSRNLLVRNHDKVVRGPANGDGRGILKVNWHFGLG